MKTNLGTRELIAIILIMIGSKLADSTPTVLAQEGKNAFWLIPIVSFLVIFPSFLLLLYLLKKFQDKNLMDLVFHLFGNFIGTLVGIGIFFIAFLALTIDSRNYVEEISTMYFPKAPTLYLFGLFFSVCIFGARRGFESIGATSFAVIPYVKLTVLLAFFLMIPLSIWQRIFPIFGDGFDVLVLEGIKKGSLFGDLIVLTMAYTSLKDSKSFHKGVYIGTFIALFEIILFFFMIATIFDYKSIDQPAFFFHEIMQYVQMGSYFTNIETFFLSFWLVAAFLRFIIYLYFTTWVLGATFRIKEFEPLILPVAFVSLTFGMYPQNPTQGILVYRDTFLNVITPFFIVLPFLLWIVAKAKGELKRDTTL